MGKSVGDDFREGKITLPVVLSYRRGVAGGTQFLEAHARGWRPDGRRSRSMRRSSWSATTPSPTRSSGRATMATSRAMRLAIFPDSALQVGAARSRRFLRRAGVLAETVCAAPPVGMVAGDAASPILLPRRPTRTDRNRWRLNPTCASVRWPARVQGLAMTSAMTGASFTADASGHCARGHLIRIDLAAGLGGHSRCSANWRKTSVDPRRTPG